MLLSIVTNIKVPTLFVAINPRNYSTQNLSGSKGWTSSRRAMRVFSRSHYVPRRDERFMSVPWGSSFRLSHVRKENAAWTRAFSVFVLARRGRSAWRWVLREARSRHSLPTAIRVYHTYLDSEDGVDGLFDAREVSLAKRPQHLILAYVDQGFLRGPNNTTAVAALAATTSSANLRRVCTRHITHVTRVARCNRRKFYHLVKAPTDFACAQTRYTTRLYCREKRVLAKRCETMRTIRGLRDSNIFTAVYDCEISIAARKVVFFILFPFYRSLPSRNTRMCNSNTL